MFQQDPSTEAIRQRDAELVHKLASQDMGAAEAALQELWGYYKPLARTIVKGRVGDPDDRDEIVADVGLSLWQMREGIDATQPVGRLVAMLAKRRVSDFYRTSSQDALDHAVSFESLALTGEEDDEECGENCTAAFVDRGCSAAGNELRPPMSSGNYRSGGGAAIELIEPRGLEEQLIAEELQEQVMGIITSLPPERIDPLIELFAGERQNVVAKKYGIATSTLGGWFADMKARIAQEVSGGNL